MIANALSRIFDGASRTRVVKNLTNALSAQEWIEQDLLSVGGGMMTKSASGIKVTHKTALEVGAVWQAVSMISGDVAMMPFHVFRRLDNGFREVDVRHPADFLISTQPNSECSAFELWRRHLVHALLWQNGYLFVGRNFRAPSAKPTFLANLLPDRTEPKRDNDGTLYYETKVGEDLKRVRLEQNEVIHTKGVCLEIDKGQDLVAVARDAWGLALAAQGFASKFFAHGANTGGILEIPRDLSERAANNLEEGFRNRGGPDEWFKAAILRDGAKFHATAVSPRDAELTGLSEVQVRQVARYFNVPPFKLGLEDSNAYNSAEMAQLVYLMSCLNHWMSAVKHATTIKLLTRKELEDRTHFLAHNPSVLVETDTKTMNEVLAIQRSNEIINANEWRAKINLNARDDEAANEYFNPNTRSERSQSADTDVDPEPTDTQRQMVFHSLSKAGRRLGVFVAKEDEAKWRRIEQRERARVRDDLRPIADVIAESLGYNGEHLCRRWEDSLFSTAERLIGCTDAENVLGRQLPEAIAALLDYGDRYETPTFEHCDT